MLFGEGDIGDEAACLRVYCLLHLPVLLFGLGISFAETCPVEEDASGTAIVD